MLFVILEHFHSFIKNFVYGTKFISYMILIYLEKADTKTITFRMYYIIETANVLKWFSVVLTFPSHSQSSYCSWLIKASKVFSLARVCCSQSSRRVTLTVGQRLAEGVLLSVSCLHYECSVCKISALWFTSLFKEPSESSSISMAYFGAGMES